MQIIRVSSPSNNKAVPQHQLHKANSQNFLARTAVIILHLAIPMMLSAAELAIPALPATENAMLNSAHITIFNDCLKNLVSAHPAKEKRRLAIDIYDQMSDATKEFANDLLTESFNTSILTLWDDEAADIKKNIALQRLISLLEEQSINRRALLEEYNALAPHLKQEAAWIIKFIAGKPIAEFMLAEKMYQEARRDFERETEKSSYAFSHELDQMKKGLDQVSKQLAFLQAAALGTQEQSALYSRFVAALENDQYEPILNELSIEEAARLLLMAHKTENPPAYEKLLDQFILLFRKNCIALYKKKMEWPFPRNLEEMIIEYLLEHNQRLALLFDSPPVESTLLDPAPTAPETAEDHVPVVTPHRTMLVSPDKTTSPRLFKTRDPIASKNGQKSITMLDGIARVWDNSTNTEWCSFECSAFTCMAINDDGIIAVATADSLHLYDLTLQPFYTFNTGDNSVTSLAFTPEQVMLIVAHAAGNTTLLDVGLVLHKQELKASLSLNNALLLYCSLLENNKVQTNKLIALLPEGLQALAYELIA